MTGAILWLLLAIKRWCSTWELEEPRLKSHDVQCSQSTMLTEQLWTAAVSVPNLPHGVIVRIKWWVRKEKERLAVCADLLGGSTGSKMKQFTLFSVFALLNALNPGSCDESCEEVLCTSPGCSCWSLKVLPRDRQSCFSAYLLSPKQLIIPAHLPLNP